MHYPIPANTSPFWYQHFPSRSQSHRRDHCAERGGGRHHGTGLRLPGRPHFLHATARADFEKRRNVRQAPVGRPWRLLFFGRIHEYKGLDLLAQAYALLGERFSVTLRVVGEGHVEALKKLAALPGVTIEQGWVPDTKITSVFSQADIIVLPYIEASQSGVFVKCYGSWRPRRCDTGGRPQRRSSRGRQACWPKRQRRRGWQRQLQT